MLALGPLAFLSPLVLLALALLPALWWLLRVTPPAPRQIDFPAVRLLFGLRPPQETPARTPWWLLLLRLLIAALVILGLAQPVLNPTLRLGGEGPVLLVVDDGWAAARDWDDRRRLLAALVQQAGRENRPVALLTTAPSPAGKPEAGLSLMPAGDAERLVAALEPKPWPSDRAGLLARLQDVGPGEPAEIVWLSDGLADGAARPLAERLSALGALTVFRSAPEGLARILRPPGGDGLALELRVERAAAGFPETVPVKALDETGGLIATAAVAFAPEAREATAALTLPVELRNRIARLSIDGEATAGATLLLDERWRRRPVGLVSTGPLEDAQPLLSDLYYLERALEPFTEIRRGEIDELLSQSLAVIALPDVGALPEAAAAALAGWVERGGLLLRFAGPRLAEADDRLLPVALRRGGRTLGGSMTWDTPARLAAFPEQSPLAGLAIPDEVTVRRQVLAEPALDLPEKTWARLTDGTPLITGAARGEGWVALVHTTANAEWSNLPLSGLFVEVLRRLVAVSQGVVGGGIDRPLPPIQTIDGRGRLAPPGAAVLPLDAETLAEAAVGPSHPPGLYGSEGQRRAFNLAPAVPTLTPLPRLPAGVAETGYGESREIEIGPWLLAAALLLVLLDLIVALALRGLLPRLARRSPASLAAAVAAGLALGGTALPAAAQERGDARAIAATRETRLAYVITGVPAVDQVSRAGLQGLSRVLARRTAVEPADPMGVALGRDELAFFPLLYWPIAPEQRDLDQPAVSALNDYLEDGGTVLIDLREPSAGASLLGQTTQATAALRRLTEGVAVPPLTPVPPDHVLTKAFYLMQDFPGRFAGGALWVEDGESADRDGVASVVVGANDWAGAWAVDELGRPLAAVVPGGERQREMAYRVGVNLVMYALTGNYKADQVHVPFILERLGQ